FFSTSLAVFFGTRTKKQPGAFHSFSEYASRKPAAFSPVWRTVSFTLTTSPTFSLAWAGVRSAAASTSSIVSIEHLLRVGFAILARMDTIHLIERRPHRVRLAADEAAWLRASARGVVEVMPEAARGIYRLTPGGFVGTLFGPRRRIEIASRIPA